MSKRNKILFGILIAFVGIVISQRFSSQKSEIANKKTETNISPSTTKKLATQENEGGNVTVTAQPELLQLGQKPKFKLEFNTHSVDLSFDIAKQSLLVDDKGNRFEGAAWTGDPAGGHHRSGELIFSENLQKTNAITLVLENISGVKERRFMWKL